VIIEGAGGHAGGVLMPDRRDALCAAAELILAIEHGGANQRRDRHGGHRGNLRCLSGGSQQHSGQGADQCGHTRHKPGRRRDGVLRALDAACRLTATNRQVKIHSDLLNADAPAIAARRSLRLFPKPARNMDLVFLP